MTREMSVVTSAMRSVCHSTRAYTGSLAMMR